MPGDGRSWALCAVLVEAMALAPTKRAPCTRVLSRFLLSNLARSAEVSDTLGMQVEAMLFGCG